MSQTKQAGASSPACALFAACQLCPRACAVDRTQGKRGFCGAPDHLVAAHAMLHQWEEPPIAGTNGSGTVFFSHCTLRCVFCQNRAISRKESSGKALSVEDLVQTFLSLATRGAHNINLVTPSHYAPLLVEALEGARARGLTLPVVYNCGGYECVSTLKLFDGLVDIYLPDYKYYSSYYASLYSCAPDYHDYVVDAIDEMVRQTGPPVLDARGLMQRGTIVRHLMLPGLGSDTAQVLRELAVRWGDTILVSLMRQYTPFHMEDYPALNRTITDEEYQQACDLFTEYGLSGFFQQGQAAQQSFIPTFCGEGLVCST